MTPRTYTPKDKTAIQHIFTQYWTDQEFLDELAQNIDADEIHFYVAEKDSEIIGVAGFREAPKYLHTYAKTKNPAELYVIASKLQNKGFGKLLAQKVIEEAKKLNFTEIMCYSPETHNSSWKFYEKLGFEKYGIIKDPDGGYSGILWRKAIF